MVRYLDRAVRFVIVAAFSMMVVATVLQVVTRYVLNHPLGWTEELAKLLMVWWTFLGVGLLSWHEKLLGIDAGLMALGPRTAHLLAAAAQAVSAISIAILTWLGIRLVGLAGTQITPALDIPYAWIYLSLPVGLGIATAGFVWRAWHHLHVGLSKAPGHPIVILDRTDT